MNYDTQMALISLFSLIGGVIVGVYLGSFWFGAIAVLILHSSYMSQMRDEITKAQYKEMKEKRKGKIIGD